MIFFFYLCYITTTTNTGIILTPIMYPRRLPCSSPSSQTAAVLHAPQVPTNFPLRCSIIYDRKLSLFWSNHVENCARDIFQVQNQLVEVVTSLPSLFLQWLHCHLLHMRLRCTARQSHQPQLILNASCCSCTLHRRSPTSAFARAQSC